MSATTPEPANCDRGVKLHPAVVELLGDGVFEETAIDAKLLCERIGAFIAGNEFPLVARGQATFAWLVWPIGSNWCAGYMRVSIESPSSG